MPSPSIVGPSVLLALSLSPVAWGGESRELAARLRAEAASYETYEAVNRRYAPMPLTASILLQTRYTVNFRQNPSPFDDSRLDTIGFSIPRAQVRLDANIANEQLLAHVTFDFGDAEGHRGRGTGAEAVPPGEGSPQLREAWVQYNFAGEQTGYYLKAGQFRSLLVHEDAVAPEHQLAVERSVVNGFFGTGVTQGAALGFVGPNYAWEVSLNDGVRFSGHREAVNSAFDSELESDFALSARFDWKLAGDWGRFADFTSWRGDEPAARVGAGLHWERQGDTNPGTSDPDYLTGGTKDMSNLLWTIDASYETDGWHAFVAYVGTRLEWEFPAITLLFVHHGLVAQAGMFLSDDVEVFARYDGILLDPTLVNGFGGDQKYHQFLTVGANWYLTPMSHAAKFQVDFTGALEPSGVLNAGVGDTVFFPDPTVTGLLGGTNHEWMLRAQLQLLF